MEKRGSTWNDVNNQRAPVLVFMIIGASNEKVRLISAQLFCFRRKVKLYIYWY